MSIAFILAVCTQFVNPFIGTDGEGRCVPGAACPNSLVNAGPDTGNWDAPHCSGYVSGERTVYGFSQTHVSGVGRITCGDVMVLPFKDRFPGVRVPALLNPRTESSEPGHYGVNLEDGTRVDITATPHVAFYRIVPKDSSTLELLVDLQYGLVAPSWEINRHVKSASATPCADRRGIDGRRVAYSWVNRDCSFAIRFDSAWASVRELPKEEGQVAPRYVVRFENLPSEGLLVKIALSTRSVDGARANLAAELPGWDFAAVRTAARDKWEKLLSRVEIPGTDGDRRICFYTALYHLFQTPVNIADAGEKPFYSTFSLWDTFRAAHPLYTLLAPELVPDFVDSMLRQGEITGFLPIWALWGEDNQCMIGSHAVPVIVDAVLKGLVDRPTAERAMAAVKDTLTATHPNRHKENWDVWDRYGYYPYDVITSEGVSRTLECCYDDACAARLAAYLGRAEDAAFFTRRAGNWTNVFDRTVGFVRGRDAKGRWREPFDPLALGTGHWRKGDFTEGNSWQYSWHVLHAPETLIELMGGKAVAAEKLERLFTQTSGKTDADNAAVTGYYGQYAHGNEPSHHVIYLFQYMDRPDLTAKYLKLVTDRFHLNAPNGLAGNDDCGQMSAWFVFACLGFYPVDPCGGAYVLGVPQVPKAVVRLANGKTLNVVAEGVPEKSFYVKAVKLNGRSADGKFVRHEDILLGGELVFEMTAED